MGTSLLTSLTLFWSIWYSLVENLPKRLSVYQDATRAFVILFGPKAELSVMAAQVDLEVQGSNSLTEAGISVEEQPPPRINNYGIVESLVSSRND